MLIDAALIDAWRLALGTLTAVPTRSPRQVNAATARAAMLLAPLAVLPLGLLVSFTLAAGRVLDLPQLAVGFAAVGMLALATRCLHWDGVSDVADGLTASYDADRSLAVMKSGTSGPAGTVAVIVLIGIQAACLGVLAASWRGLIVAGVVVCVSRTALWVTCARGVPAARVGGLGSSFTGSVPVPVAALAVVLTGVVPGLAVLALVRRCVRRLGGVTGDVFGAAIEVAFTTALLGTAWLG